MSGQDEGWNGDQLKELFRHYDANGDGFISLNELSAVLDALGGGFSQEEIQHVFTCIDKSHDGKIQYNEFVDWLSDDTVSPLAVCKPDDCRGKQAEIRHILKQGRKLITSKQLAGIEFSFDGGESDFPDVVQGLQLLTAKQLRSAFVEADIDNSGHIQLEELRKLIFPAGASDSDKTTVAKLFAQMDRNRDGMVLCAEFVAYILETKKRLSTVPTSADKKQLASTFNKADRDGNGNISVAEFQELLNASTEEEQQLVQKAFAKVDKNGDGVLSIVEFCRIYGKELVEEAKGVEVTWMDVPEEEESDDD